MGLILGVRADLQSSINGRFSFIEGALVAFYRDNGVLKLRVENEEHVIDDLTSSQLDEKRDTLNSLIPLKLRGLGGSQNKSFSLIHDGVSVLTLAYSFSAAKIAFDPTPFIDEEDSDFMLFIHRVLHDPERRKNIWTT